MEVGYNGGELEYTGTQWRNYEPPEEAVREYPTNVFYSQEASYPIAKFTVWNVWALGEKSKDCYGIDMYKCIKNEGTNGNTQETTIRQWEKDEFERRKTGREKHNMTYGKK